MVTCQFPYEHVQLAALPPVKVVVESLEKAGVPYTLFDNVSIEPTNERCAFILFYIHGLLCVHEISVWQRPSPSSKSINLMGLLLLVAGL